METWYLQAAVHRKQQRQHAQLFVSCLAQQRTTGDSTHSKTQQEDSVSG
jgi:hypothetical protein